MIMTNEPTMVGQGANAASSLLNGKRIAIAGAGPCGLTLARLLQQQGADVRIFEMESSAAARNQGGTLDLHEDSGQLALRKAGLHDQFLSLCRPEGQAVKVVDKHGRVFVDLQPEDEAEMRPEIDRGLLRSLLIDSMAPDTIKWGWQIEDVKALEGGRFCIKSTDDQQFDADLLFGCDGTWSKVRPFVSTTKPYYGGLTIIETWILSADKRYPAVAKLVGPGILLATSDDKALIAQRNGDGNIRIYVALRVPEDWTRQCGIDFTKVDQARQGLIGIFDGWEPHLHEMIEASEVFIPRSLYTHPPRQSAWCARTSVTLLGDAAHVMPFFTGRGVNLAMLDAVELAENLTSGAFSNVADAIRAYERTMFDRMAVEIATNLADQDVFISPYAPAGIKELLQRRIEAGEQREKERSGAG